ncbi:MAG TPA: hypothetical protein PKL31_10850 [Fulvivirga sp.]|nr:hypothetical protein [Fulvivirga sp.]
MKIIKYLFLVTLVTSLMAVAGCSSDDGEGTPEKFAFTVLNGENSDPSTGASPIEGATVEVYSSRDSYFNGDSPLKTLTTGADGVARSNDAFPSTAVVYAESGNFNNWPNINELTADPGIEGRFQGSAVVYLSFKTDFENIQNINFVISDVFFGDVSTFSALADCSKDNYVTLTRGNEYTYSEGSNVCSGLSGGDYTISGLGSKNQTNEETLAGIACYQFITDWSNTYSSIYIAQDFSKILIKDFDNNSAKTTITVYSK